MVDFVLLPPEINSARMYSGPGAGPLLAAAGSWDALSAELHNTAESYGAVLSGLTRLHWRGPAAQSMSTTAARYATWLTCTAEQAMQTARQARAAAAAYELAYAMTVPPAAVTANRDQLAALVATNFFGQNTAAIAATEAQYAEYWAQDATAMYGYAASSAATTRLTPFNSPRPTTNQDAASAQDAAVARAVNSTASNLLAQNTSGAGAPTNSTSAPADFDFTDGALALFASTDNMASLESFPQDIIGACRSAGLLPGSRALPAVSAPLPALATATPNVGRGLGAVSATLGGAGSIGSMSVPAGWAGPATGPAAVLPSPGSPTLVATGELVNSGYGLPGVPGMRPPYRATLLVPRYGVRVRVLPPAPATW